MLFHLLVLNLEVKVAGKPIVEERLLNIASRVQLNKKPYIEKKKHI